MQGSRTMRRAQTQRGVIHYRALALCIDCKRVASFAVQPLRGGGRPSGKPCPIKRGSGRSCSRTMAELGERRYHYRNKTRALHDLTSIRVEKNPAFSCGIIRPNPHGCGERARQKPGGEFAGAWAGAGGRAGRAASGAGRTGHGRLSDRSARGGQGENGGPAALTGNRARDGRNSRVMVRLRRRGQA